MVDVVRFGIDLKIFGFVTRQIDRGDLLERFRIDDEEAGAIVFICVDAADTGIVRDRIDRTVDGSRAQDRLRLGIDFTHGPPLPLPVNT